jgi:Flp pilus assembly protein TadG
MKTCRRESGEKTGTKEAIEDGESTPTLTVMSFNVHKMYRSFRKQRGAAAVEFACVLPVFVILVFGMIEYGRMVMVQQMLTNATREGARQAVVDGATIGTVRTTVKDYVSAGGITLLDSEITVSPDPSAATSGTPITVSVQLAYTKVSWFPPMFLGSTNLNSASVMRRESSQSST